MKNFFEVALKLLSVLVIPLILWGVSLEVRLAVQGNDLQRNATAIEQIKVELKEVKVAVSSVKDSVNVNANSLGRVEEKLNGMDKNIVEIKGLLQRR